MVAHAVMFHHFHDRTHPQGQGALSVDEFAAIIRLIDRTRILPADEWMARALEGGLGEDDVCLSFDDALLCQYDVAYPVLEDLGLKAFWFVYSSVFQGKLERLEVYRYFRTVAFADIEAFYDAFFAQVRARYGEEKERALRGFDPASYLTQYSFYSDTDRVFRYLRDVVLGVDRYNDVMDAMIEDAGFSAESIRSHLWMTDDNLRELAAGGHVAGLHSFTHPTCMEKLPLAEQRDEYARNRTHLSGVLGTAPTCMSHPCNSYGADTLEILRSMGVRLGFRSNMGAVENRSVLEFPRTDHADLVKLVR